MGYFVDGARANGSAKDAKEREERERIHVLTELNGFPPAAFLRTSETTPHSVKILLLTDWYRDNVVPSPRTDADSQPNATTGLGWMSIVRFKRDVYRSTG